MVSILFLGCVGKRIPVSYYYTTEGYNMLLGINIDRIYNDISIFTTYIFWAIVYSLGQAYILQFFWNMTIPNITVLFTALSYKHAFGLIIIIRILTRSWVKDTLQQAAANQMFATQEIRGILHNLLIMVSAKINLDESRIQYFDAFNKSNIDDENNNVNENNDLEKRL